MAQNKMLIDAAHSEETRVVVVRGNRVDEFDFESENKTQIRGNIYLAKVTRVEPSLQAAFVDYGGNRHGFLAFSEIHPDYYQIPIADRQALLAEDEAEEIEENAKEEEIKPVRRRRRSRRKPTADKTEAANDGDNQDKSTDITESAGDDADKDVDNEAEKSEIDAVGSNDDPATENEVSPNTAEDADTAAGETGSDASADDNADSGDTNSDDDETPTSMAAANESDVISEPADADDEDDTDDSEPDDDEDTDADDLEAAADDDDDSDEDVESVGVEDALEEVPVRRKKRRQYKIQEVIKRRQIILVQVVKEERGNKGAALTTYLSLAGRYSVLMPNTARGGGISRKITNLADRKRLKTIAGDLDVAEGMGVILRTAGASRTKPEIRRDFEYLLRLWENVRNLTLQSTAPCLVYEEGSLIKRSIRDLYDKDTGEIYVSGDAAYNEAKNFMRMLMPSHAKFVKRYTDKVPIFARNGVEAQLDKMLQPQVTLKSGGYLVINQTEALVAIDVNSGRATRHHSIEDTATQTNLEAAEEVARQLRLRDLAGLIVVDFIDMEEKRNNRAVEKRLKDALKNDRARIQVSRISHFGLLEMSRQRIRASVLESTTKVCPTCEGVGHVRSASSVALYVLRSIEENLLKGSRHNLIIKTSAETALYILNSKRMHLVDLEARFGVTISMEVDASIGNQYMAIERGELATPRVKAENHVQPDSFWPDQNDDVDDDLAAGEESDEEADITESRDDEDHPKRKRRRSRRGRGRSNAASEDASGESETAEGASSDDEPSEDTPTPSDEAPTKRRRRGRRGGRNNKQAEAADVQTAEETTDVVEAVSENASEADQPAADPVEEKPSRNRRPRRKKKPLPDETVDVVTAEDEVVVEEKADDVEKEEAKPPRRTSRRPRKKKVEEQVETASDAAGEVAPTAAAEEPQTADISEPDADEEPAKPRRTTRRKSKAKTESEPVVADQVVAKVDTVEEPKEQDRDKKAGWWQRRSFF